MIRFCFLLLTHLAKRWQQRALARRSQIEAKRFERGGLIWQICSKPFVTCLTSGVVACGALCALERADEGAIHQVIEKYTRSWNENECRGFADDFSEKADFVNIFGMKFSGKKEIEERHVKILQTIFKGSKLEILDTQLREVQPGLVIANIVWGLDGFHQPGERREGIFTQVFVKNQDKWEITASQNTLFAKK